MLLNRKPLKFVSLDYGSGSLTRHQLSRSTEPSFPYYLRVVNSKRRRGVWTLRVGCDTEFWIVRTSLIKNDTILTFGKILHSNPHMLKRRLGLSLEYTLTKLFSHWIVVTDLGRRFLMSQNTARPLYKSCEKHNHIFFNKLTNSRRVSSIASLHL